VRGKGNHGKKGDGEVDVLRHGETLLIGFKKRGGAHYSKLFKRMSMGGAVSPGQSHSWGASTQSLVAGEMFWGKFFNCSFGGGGRRWGLLCGEPGKSVS